MLKLKAKFAFQSNHNLYKETGGSSMGGLLPIKLSGIHMIRTERYLVIPLKSRFYKKYVDDIYNQRRKN